MVARKQKYPVMATLCAWWSILLVFCVTAVEAVAPTSLLRAAEPASGKVGNRVAGYAAEPRRLVPWGRGPHEREASGNAGPRPLPGMSLLQAASRPLTHYGVRRYPGQIPTVEMNAARDTLWGLPKLMWVIVADVLAMLAFLGCIPMILGMAKRKKAVLQ